MRPIVTLFCLLLFDAHAFAEPPPPLPPYPWAQLPKQVSAFMESSRLDYLLPNDEDDTKAIEGVSPKLSIRRKVKDCCGYPLGEPGTYKMTFYWLAWENEYSNEPYTIDVYTKQGFVIGRFPRTFVFELKMEGSGMLRDGRALNYDGRCNYGIGICFQTLNPAEHPLGKGGQGRPLVPFRSVAVDPHFVPLGTPLYIPELTNLILPDGSRHDGCVRADDTGGNIRRRELDFFVESYANYKFLDDQFWGNNHMTPYVEEARCAYLRTYDPVLDRRSEASDWAQRHPPLPLKPAPTGKQPPSHQSSHHKAHSSSGLSAKKKHASR